MRSELHIQGSNIVVDVFRGDRTGTYMFTGPRVDFDELQSKVTELENQLLEIRE